MVEERRLTTVNSRPQQQGQALDLHSLRRDLTTPTSGDMYSVNKKERPGARVARALALEYRIATEIMEYGKDSEKAWCKVRGWLLDDPLMTHQSIVVDRYEDLLRQAVFDCIDNGMYVPTGQRNENGRLITKFKVPEFEIGPDGFPMFKDKYTQFQLMRNHLNKIKFAERSTMGKAERNVILKLLGKEDDGTTETPEKIEPETKPTPEQNELAACRIRIVALLLRVHDGKKDLAKESFATVAKSLNIDAALPSELTNLNDAKRIFEAIRKLLPESSPAVEVEAEVDDPEINGPLTAEEEARMQHDE